MEILHLCSYYNTSSLYKNLISTLAKNKDLKQHVYIPMMNNSESFSKDHSTVNNKTKDTDNIFHYYEEIFNTFNSKIYSLKVNKYKYELLNRIKLDNIDFIHSHSLFVNGRVAYELKSKYNIRYIVAVRATDIETFFAKLIHLRPMGIKIMQQAEKVICISYSLKEKLLKYIPLSLKKEIANKIIVIPNGIDDYWFERQEEIVKDKVYTEHINLYYTGALLKRKNVDKVIQATESLDEQGYKVKLKIIGNGPYETKIQQQIKKTKAVISKEEWTRDKKKLADIVRSSDIFVMPSVGETFGLVYVEALSQGKPIIYTRNDGIDGFFEDGVVGYAVNPNEVNDIVNKILLIKKNYDQMKQECIQKSKSFKWIDISNKYLDIYYNR